MVEYDFFDFLEMLWRLSFDDYRYFRAGVAGPYSRPPAISEIYAYAVHGIAWVYTLKMSCDTVYDPEFIFVRTCWARLLHRISFGESVKKMREWFF